MTLSSGIVAAGTYRHRISILARTPDAEDALGQSGPSAWQPLLTGISAMVEDLSGRGLLAAQQVHGEVTSRIFLRYRAALAPGIRVVFGADVYTVLAVLRMDAVNVELALLCSKGTVDPGT